MIDNGCLPHNESCGAQGQFRNRTKARKPDRHPDLSRSHNSFSSNFGVLGFDLPVKKNINTKVDKIHQIQTFVIIEVSK